MLPGGPGFSAGPQFGGDGGGGLAVTPDAQGAATAPSGLTPGKEAGGSGLRGAAPPARTDDQDVDGRLGLQAPQAHGQLVAAGV